MYNDIDFTDTQELEKIENEINENDRQMLIESLKLDLKMPLPEELQKKAEVINNRLDTINTIKKLNNNINAFGWAWTPLPAENLPLITESGPPKPDWIIENWLPRNELTVFSGMGGYGKSHIMLNLACATACGCPEAYLDTQGKTEPDRADKAMYATWEDSHASVQRRVDRIKHSFNSWFDEKAVKNHVIFRDMKPQGQIWIPASDWGHISNRGIMAQAGHELLATCVDERISLLVLDSIAAVFGQDLNSAAHVRPFLNYLSAWANENKITIVLIGHPNKTGQGGPSGSVDWHNGVRSRWELDKKGEDEGADNKPYYVLIHAKANDAPQMPDIPLIRNTNGIYEMATGTDINQKIQKAQKAYQDYHQHWENWTSQEDINDDKEINEANIPEF